MENFTIILNDLPLSENVVKIGFALRTIDETGNVAEISNVAVLDLFMVSPIIFIEEKSPAVGIIIGILVVILLIAVVIGIMYYKGMIFKTEAKGSDETVDDVDVEMKKDADVEADEAEKEKLVDEPA